MAKKIKAVVKVQIQAGKATAAPPVGTALGPHGINMGQFIKEYNERTAALTGTVVPAVVTVFEDRSYTFVTKSPPAADLIRREAGIEKGSGKPNKEKVGKISRAQVKKIAETKLADLNATSIEGAMKMVEGTTQHGRGNRLLEAQRITSARASTFIGTSRPIAAAVFALTTSSKLDGRSTGMSLAAVPRSRRATKVAAERCISAMGRV